MSNVSEQSKSFLARLIQLETEKRNNAEDRKEIGTEMKAAELSKAEIDGIKLAVRRHFETQERRLHRESVEDVASALGEFADLPLGSAAVRAAA